MINDRFSCFHPQKLKQKTSLGLILTLVFAAVICYIFNSFTPLYADDYCYSYSFKTWERIESVSDIFPSIAAHYFNTNGRLVTHFLAQLFLLMPKPLFNVINSLVLVGLGLLIYWYADFKKEKISVFNLFLIYVLIYFLPPAFGQSFLWIDGCANYLYGPLIVLVYFIPYRRYLKGNDSVTLKKTLVMSVFSFLFGIIAASANENTGAALVAMISCVTLIALAKKDINSLWMISGLLGCLIGFSFMILSPGTRMRLDANGGMKSIAEIFLRIPSITDALWTYLKPLIVLFGVFTVIYIFTLGIKDKKAILAEIFPFIIFMIATLVSAYAMAATPYFPRRAWSGIVIFAIICLMNLLSVIKINIISDRVRKIYKRVVSTAVIFIVFMLCVSLGKTITGLYDIHLKDIERRQSISYQLQSGIEDVYVKTIPGTGKYSVIYEDGVYGDIQPDSSNWVNRAMAKYYGAKTLNLTDGK